MAQMITMAQSKRRKTAVARDLEESLLLDLDNSLTCDNQTMLDLLLHNLQAIHLCRLAMVSKRVSRVTNKPHIWAAIARACYPNQWCELMQVLPRNEHPSKERIQKFWQSCSGNTLVVDNTPPRIISLDFEPKVINPNESTVMTITLHVCDDQSGVSSVNYYFTSSVSNSEIHNVPGSIIGYIGDSSLVSGTCKDGKYVKKFEIEAFSLVAGKPLYLCCSTVDNAQNSAMFWSKDLQQLNIPTCLTVSGKKRSTDFQKPKLKEFTVSPLTIDPSVDNKLHIRARITHKGHGFMFGLFSLSESGIDYHGGIDSVCQSITIQDLVEGDKFDGVYETTLSLSANRLKPGKNLYSSAYLRDRINNCSELAAGYMSQKGFAATLTVLGNAEDYDDTPPKLVGLTMIPQVINPSVHNVLKIVIDVEHPRAGFDFAELKLRSKNHFLKNKNERTTSNGAPCQSIRVCFGKCRISNGDYKRGSYTRLLDIAPDSMAPGSQLLLSGYVADRTGNVVDFSSHELEKLGMPFMLQVTN